MTLSYDMPGDMRIPVPSMLYGVTGCAGRGWRKVARKAWKSGWKEALSGIEWIDMAKTPGVIVLERAPSKLLSPQYAMQPFFAMYQVPETMMKIESNRLRLRDLVLEALDWPWYAMSTFWPHNFLPPYDSFFSSWEEWQAEEKRVAKIALQKIIRHFPLLAPLERRFTGDGQFDMPIPPPCGILVMGVLGHCGKLGLSGEFLRELMTLPHGEAERRLLVWIKENGLLGEGKTGHGKEKEKEKGA